MPRVSLLVADDVGLGKTIEAGLVVLELVIRHRARRVLVVCPASLQVQWRDQMRDKFGLDFRIVDSELMRSLRRSRGLHVNPWTHFPRLITSIDFLKRERPLRLFREALPSGDEPAYPRRFDVLVLDEAHNVAPAGRGHYATDSLRTEAVRLLGPHFEHKLFLTATPHNGYPESFSALLELLDSQRFARGVSPDRQQLGAVMVRRLKSELPKKWDGSPRFPARKLEAIEVAYTDAERRTHAALEEYARLRHQDNADQTEHLATEFVLKLLKKRLFSSPAAFAATLAQHEKSLRQARRRAAAPRPSPGILQRQIDAIDEEYADDEEAETTTHDAVEAATRLFREPTPQEEALLREMRDWATAASARPDSKAQQLIRWLHATLKTGGKWADERVILFTEYRATQKWLETLLASEGFTGGDRLLTLYGGMHTEERERIKAAFQYDPAGSPVRILLATDAASEGIDLQNHCHRLIHYEIPWNPNRMEQRNGRVDRHGQRAKEVCVYHFVGKGYKERRGGVRTAGDLEGDLEFLMRACEKVEQIREDLGKVGPVIARQVEEAMLGRRTRLDTAGAERDAEPVRRMLKFERDLRARVQQLIDQYRYTQKELRLSPENVQAVVEIALELAEQPPLIPTEMEGIWPDPSGKRTSCPVFHLPALKWPWAQCSQGLEHPHTKEVRPIVFDARLVEGRDEVVLAHLNHRLVQMSLRLLREEVWSREGRKRLHRVTARLVPDGVLDTPAMIAHARLVLIGGDHHRLHEEIITAGGLIREGRFARMNVGQVRDALATALPEEPAEEVKERLIELWPKHSASLIQALEARMRDRAAGLQRELAERADKEVRDVAAILTELQKTIQAELDEPAYQQLELFSTPEREQFERNRDALRARVKQIPEEIEKETAAVRARFADPQPRLFPVAVTYLVPERIGRRPGVQSMNLGDFLPTRVNDPLRSELWMLYQHMEGYLLSLGFTPTIVRVIESAGCGYFDPNVPCIAIPYRSDDKGALFHEATHDLFHHSVFHRDHNPVNAFPIGSDHNPNYNEGWGEGFCEAVRWLMEMAYLPLSAWLQRYPHEVKTDWRKQRGDRILSYLSRSLSQFERGWKQLVQGYDCTADYLNRTVR
jgi:superfamily II DNA/RNA helicase